MIARVSARALALSIFIISGWSVTACASPEIFTADRPCIIHADDNSSSADIGRLETGDTAPVLDYSGRWVQIEINGEEGWVYGPRGRITAQVAPQATSGEMSFWFGNMHAHTSEGSSESGVTESTHEDAFAYAMDDTKGNLDFLAVTPHTHLIAEDTYDNLLETVRDDTYDIPGTFVPIAGQEFSTTSKGNHLNVFELDAWIDPDVVANGEYRKLFDEFIPDHDTQHTFSQFNHPYSTTLSSKGGHYGKPTGSTAAWLQSIDRYEDVEQWVEAVDSTVQVIEVISAPSHQSPTDRPHYDEDTNRLNAWFWALSHGLHIGPAANQDNHKGNWGTGSDSRTVAIAATLDHDSITGAFRQRRFYASEDSTMEITFKTGDYWMGSVAPYDDFGVFTVKGEDPEETQAEYTFDLFCAHQHGDALRHDSNPTDTITLAHGIVGELTVDEEQYEPGLYCLMRTTQSQTADDENETADNAWTAPIWLEEFD